MLITKAQNRSYYYFVKKGRTGTAICIYQLHRGIFRDAEKSLSYFGERRTDKQIDEKFQVRFYDIYEVVQRS